MRRLRCYPQMGLSKNIVIERANLDKWKQTKLKIDKLSKLYLKYSKDQLIDYLTKDWNVNEKNRFLYWLKKEDEKLEKKYMV